jgi:hypothetical protein
MMKKILSIFTSILFTGIILFSLPAFSLDISEITNPNNFQQTTNQATYTVAQDGKSLLYRNQNTGMQLKQAAQAGSKITVRDPAIAPRVVTNNRNVNNNNNNRNINNNNNNNNQNVNNNGNSKGKFGGLSRGMKWGLAAAGVALGAYGVYQSASGQGPHSWGDVLGGAASGAMGGAAMGTFTFIPFGTLAGGIGGAVVGGITAGSQLFSETDCETDPRIGVYTCCHTQFNQGERYADIGDFMFCDEVPKIKYCMNGDSLTSKNILKDDHWGACTEDDKMWCPGYSRPDAEEGVLYDGMLIVDNALKTKQDLSSEDAAKYAKICMLWNCDNENGYTKSGNHCKKSGNGPAYVGGTNGGDTTDAAYTGTVPADSTIDSLLESLQLMRQRIIGECTVNI